MTDQEITECKKAFMDERASLLDNFNLILRDNLELRSALTEKMQHLAASEKACAEYQRDNARLRGVVTQHEWYESQQAAAARRGDVPGDWQAGKPVNGAVIEFHWRGRANARYGRVGGDGLIRNGGDLFNPIDCERWRYAVSPAAPIEGKHFEMFCNAECDTLDDQQDDITPLRCTVIVHEPPATEPPKPPDVNLKDFRRVANGIHRYSSGYVESLMVNSADEIESLRLQLAAKDAG